jgi:hypothetical protein
MLGWSDAVVPGSSVLPLPQAASVKAPSSSGAATILREITDPP